MTPVLRDTRLVVIGLLLAVCLAPTAAAQGPQARRSVHAWPDSLDLVTVTGTMIVNTVNARPSYYLDEDGDGSSDYHLALGPWWYVPESGLPRPEAGTTVTIMGALQYTLTGPKILVFEIDGEVWRTPIEYGRVGWNCEPFWGTQGDTLTVTGTVRIDTTYYYIHYYLDVTGDEAPEYRLGFGPPWYEPAAVPTRPVEGQVVTVFGRLHVTDGLDVLTVYTLDGLLWRPADEPAPWAGRWVRRAHAHVSEIPCMNCPVDRLGWIHFPPGHMGHGTGGPWPDSIFVQFWEIHPDSLPGPHRHRFAGFFIDVHDPLRRSLMHRHGDNGNGQGERLRFEEQHRIRIRYAEHDLRQRGLLETGLMLHFWHAHDQQWVPIPDAEIDVTANTVTFVSYDLAGYYAVLAPNLATARETALNDLPRSTTLLQNYPNPFNPSTTIRFELDAAGFVELEVFDVLGRRVATLVQANLPVGTYTAGWDGRDETGTPVAGGLYLYRLTTGSDHATRTMLLLK